MNRVACIALALMTAGCASIGQFSHSRTGLDPSVFLADSETCQTQGREAANVRPGTPGYNPALASQAGAAFGAGIAEGIAKAKAMTEAFNLCMAQLNYIRVALTPEEQSPFKALKTVDERKAWITTSAAQNNEARAVPPAECKSNALVTCTTP